MALRHFLILFRLRIIGSHPSHATLLIYVSFEIAANEPRQAQGPMLGQDRPNSKAMGRRGVRAPRRGMALLSKRQESP